MAADLRAAALHGHDGIHGPVCTETHAEPHVAGHSFVQWTEKPDYPYCMALVPDGPGWLRICRQLRSAHEEKGGER